MSEFIARQGDVLIRRVASIPQEARPKERDGGRVILAYGEVTGHAHQKRVPTQECEGSGRMKIAGAIVILILGAFVVKASSSNIGPRNQSGRLWSEAATLDGGALIASAHDNEHVRPLTANAHDDERISPIARGKISIPDIIRQAALEFSQSPDEMLAVAFCESSLNPMAVGDGGAAIGLFQIHIWRWNLNAPHLGYTEDLRADPVAASRVAAYAFSTGQRAAWTCAR